MCGPVVQLVRTLACHARGRRFEPVPGRHTFASVAQSVEQGTENPRVIGSIPIGGTIYAELAHLVERHLAKVEVASSSLVFRSIIRHHSQAVRPRSAKSLFPRSILGGASKKLSATHSFYIPWEHSSAGRASALQAEGHRFEPCCSHQCVAR